MELTIIKKDGTTEEFKPEKIIAAIDKSASRVMIKLTDEDHKTVVDTVIRKIEDFEMEEIKVLDMHSFVEAALEEFNPIVAKSYKDYRNYKYDFVHMMDKVYERSQAIRYIGDKENGNTDSALVATKRSLIFNELNKRLYRQFFMTVDERQACRDGYIYIHDQSARLDTLNCCLFNIEPVLNGGFEMGNVWYNEPKTLDTAFDVIGDVILGTASQQYGGFTVPEIDKVLSKYAKKSYDKYYKKYHELFMREKKKTIKTVGLVFKELPVSTQQKIWKEADEAAKEQALIDVKREFEQGFQGIEMKLNTVGSSRGDYPFVTMTFGLGTDQFSRMASTIFLQVHMNGQGKEGNKKPVLFPKLVFLYDENLHGPGKELEDVFEAGIMCSSKTMYPDWLSLTGNGYVAEIYKKYGIAISPMGCVQKDEVVTYKFNGMLHVESISRMWDRVRCLYKPQIQIEGQPHQYIDVDPKMVQIYDKENGFVGTKRMVKNLSHNWARITLSNGRVLECTKDHPLPVIGKGRTFVENIQIGDRIPLNKDQYTEEQFDDFTPEFAWTLGVFLCDGCYDDQATVSIGEDELELSSYLSTEMNKRYDSEMRIVERHRGKKGDYIDLKFSNPSVISADMLYIFEGLQKAYRRIPEYIFQSNRKVRLAFLAGMIDADGYINNVNHVSIIQLGSTNKELALQQMALMQSLGIRSNIYCNHYNSLDSNKIRYRVEGEAISELLEYIKCTKKKNNFKNTERVKYSQSDIDEGVVTRIEFLDNRIDWSYDVTTESDHFDVSGIYSHNCRAFLSPWYERGGMEPADENDKPVFVGRFNIGAVSLNLPMILAKARKESRDFYEVLDYYLEMIRGIHKRTYDYLGNIKASTNPLGYCEGGFLGGHLKPHEKIKPILKAMTASFGITAFNELQELYNGKSLVEDGQFALDVLKYINDKVNEFKHEDGWLYAIYGTPAENLCFSGETEVQTYEGIKKIKDITTNDLVYSFNETDHKVELKCVTASMKTQTNATVVKVTFKNGQSVVCTPNHPFATPGDGKINWINAENLKPWDIVLSDPNHDDRIVDSINELKDKIDVYDITVEDNHNFFVGGMDGILVHNCGLQVKQFRKMYGIVENVSDKPYVTNSFHCHVSEDISPIEKQNLEGRFWDLCNGGKIQYVKYPVSYNIDAIRTIVRRAMELGFYEGVNLSLAYCENCGHQELEMDVCPKCGSKDLTKIDRMNGYLAYSRVHGDTRLNDAKMAEINDRKSM